ncbi:MAG: helix-hairpin-helix domain-containing protein [Syntrophomonas sp.]
MENIDRRYLAAGLVIILIIVFALGVKYADLKRAGAGEKIAIETGNSENVGQAGGKVHEKSEIQVYVCGEVNKPGVYKLEEGARLYEAIDLAGIKPTADAQSLDMARELVDGESILVSPKVEEMEGAQGGSVSPSSGESSIGSSSVKNVNSGKVNINKATAQEMDERLAGIGPALSQRIIDYRNSNGPFKQIEDIKEVSGIGDKKFEAIKGDISVR